MLSPVLFAQDSTIAGKYALQFQVGPNFQLLSFNGTTISFKYQNTKSSALRFGITVNGSSNNSDYNAKYSDGDSIHSGSDQVERYGITLNAQYLFCDNIIENIFFYYGGGPSVGLSYSRDMANMYYPLNNDGINNTSQTRASGWNAGISAACGVEWLITKRFSLSGEYGLSFSYSSSLTAYSYPSQNVNVEYKTFGYSVSGSSVKLGMSIYF